MTQDALFVAAIITTGALFIPVSVLAFQTVLRSMRNSLDPKKLMIKYRSSLETNSTMPVDSRSL